MKFLVIVGSKYIGAHIANILIELNYDVFVFEFFLKNFFGDIIWYF